MGRRARKIRQALKNAAKQKKKAAKRARYAERQAAERAYKREKAGKWRGIHREAVRDRRRIGGTISLKTFEKLLRRKDNGG